MAERAAKTIDERFDEVTQAFLDQRDFTMFCHDKLRTEIRESEGRLSGRLDGLEGRFDGLEGKIEGTAQAIDRRFTRNELLLTEILNEVKRR